MVSILKKRFKIFKLVILTILSFIIIITAYIIANQYVITTSKYSIESDRVKNDIKIAVISDLHGRDFGNDNNIIVNKISKEKPDLIAVIGDMIDEYTENDEAVLNTLKPLPEIAPTYYSIGNHDYLYSDYDNYIKTLESSGVVILNDETTKLTVGENKLTLLGLSNYSFGEVENPMYTELMKELCENDDLRIMLCHYPEFTPWFFGQDLYYESDFELMLSGHTHGGLVRLPFFGGLYAPNQGLFPEYSKGLYYIDKENKNPYHMLVTGGLGPDTRFIRINNFPEISFITVRPVK